MKKIIALALALIMVLSMGVVALADHTTPSDNCELDAEHLLPGETYEVNDLGTADDNDGATAPADKDWKVSAKWTKGGALVAGIAWNKDDEVWELTLNENYTITEAKALVGEITFEGKKDNKTADDITVKIEDVVANHLVEVTGYADLDDADMKEADDNTVYICEEDEPGFVKFNDGRLLSLTVNLESEEKVYLANNEDMIEALAEKFPEADIECYNFGSVRALKNKATLTLQADYADQYYIYTYANGKLEAQDAEWDSIEGVYTWETKTLASYVISDVELVAAADDAAQNPDTGANDVVGVAAALAVVSLVAAGAVSLKK